MTRFPKLLSLSVKIYLALFALSTIAILYGTLFPSNNNIPDPFWNYDKVAHFLMFGIWTFFYGIIRFLNGRYALWPVFLWGVFFGVLIEALQMVLPTNRNAEFLDLVADISGSAFAILLLFIILKNVSELKRPPAS